MPSEADHERRLAAMERLAASIRSLCDAATSTDVAPEAVDEVRELVDRCSERLRERHHDGPYSGLHRSRGDYSDPHAVLPLSPIIGRFNPCSPDVTLALRDGGVVGRARLTKRHVGPPGMAHGGITAMIADQLIAVAPFTLDANPRYVTRELRVRYRAPTPLFEELELEAHCDPETEGFPDRVRSTGTIRAGGRTTVEIEATSARATHLTNPKERRSAPPG